MSSTITLKALKNQKALKIYTTRSPFFACYVEHDVIENRDNYSYSLFNKLTSVFHASVLLLIMNFVITLSK